MTRYLALEQLWIMTNVAHGPYDLIESMLFDASAETYNHPVIPSKALALVSYALQGTDQVMHEIVLWMIGNCSAESQKISSFMYHSAKILAYIQNICQQHQEALSGQILEVILWNIDVLDEQNMIEASDLSKIALALDLAIKSANMANKVAAMQLLNKFLVNFAEECHLEVVLSEETFRRIMRLLSESTN